MGSYPILILLKAGCTLIRLARWCGTRSATGTPLRQMTKDSLEFSTVARRLEKLVFASCTFTVFMPETLVQLVHCVNALLGRAMLGSFLAPLYTASNSRVSRAFLPDFWLGRGSGWAKSFRSTARARRAYLPGASPFKVADHEIML